MPAAGADHDGEGENERAESCPHTLPPRRERGSFSGYPVRPTRWGLDSFSGSGSVARYGCAMSSAPWSVSLPSSSRAARPGSSWTRPSRMSRRRPQGCETRTPECPTRVPRARASADLRGSYCFSTPFSVGGAPPPICFRASSSVKVSSFPVRAFSEASATPGRAGSGWPSSPAREPHRG